MEELDNLFQIKPVCYWSFETHYLTDCLLRTWRVLLDFPRVQLTIHETTSPVSALLLCSRTLYSRSSLSTGRLRNPFSFMRSKGFRKSYPTGSRKMKPESVGGWGGFRVKLGYWDSPGSHLRGKHGSRVDHRGRSHH